MNQTTSYEDARQIVEAQTGVAPGRGFEDDDWWGFSPGAVGGGPLDIVADDVVHLVNKSSGEYVRSNFFEMLSEGTDLRPVS